MRFIKTAAVLVAAVATVLVGAVPAWADTGDTGVTVAAPFTTLQTQFPTDFGFSDHSAKGSGDHVYPDRDETTWHGDITEWTVVYESDEGWVSSDGQKPGKTVLQVTNFTSGSSIPTLTVPASATPGSTITGWVHLVPAGKLAATVGEAYPADAALTRAWARFSVTVSEKAPIVCPAGKVPGWLDENGQPTSCVDDNPTPNEPAQQPDATTPTTDSPAAVTPAAETTQTPAAQEAAPTVQAAPAQATPMATAATLPKTGAGSFAGWCLLAGASLMLLGGVGLLLSQIKWGRRNG